MSGRHVDAHKAMAPNAEALPFAGYNRTKADLGGPSKPSSAFGRSVAQAPGPQGSTEEETTSASEVKLGMFRKKRRQPSNLEDIGVLDIGARGSLGYRLHFYRGSAHVSPWHGIPVYGADSNHLRCICTTPAGTWLRYEVAISEPFNPIKLVKSGGQPSHYLENAPLHLAVLPQTAVRTGPLPIADALLLANSSDVIPNQTRSKIKALLEQRASSDSGGSGSGSNKRTPKERFLQSRSSGSRLKGNRWEPLSVIDISEVFNRKTGEVYTVKPLGAFVVIGQGPTVTWRIVAIDVADPRADRLHGIGDVSKRMPGMLRKVHDWLQASIADPDDGAFFLADQPADVGMTAGVIAEAHAEWQLHSPQLAKLERLTVAGDDLVTARLEQAWVADSTIESEVCLPEAKPWAPTGRHKASLARSTSLPTGDAADDERPKPLLGCWSLTNLKEALRKVDYSRHLTGPKARAELNRSVSAREAAGPPKPPDSRRFFHSGPAEMLRPSAPLESRKHSGPQESRKLSGPLESRKHSGPQESRKHSGPLDSRKHSGPLESRKHSGPLDSGRQEGVSGRHSGPQESRKHSGPLDGGRLEGGRAPGTVESRRHSGPQEAMAARLAGSLDNRKFSGPLENRRFSGALEGRRYSGPIEIRRQLGPPEGRRYYSGPIETRRHSSPLERRRHSGPLDGNGLASTRKGPVEPDSGRRSAYQRPTSGERQARVDLFPTILEEAQAERRKSSGTGGVLAAVSSEDIRRFEKEGKAVQTSGARPPLFPQYVGSSMPEMRALGKDGKSQSESKPQGKEGKESSGGLSNWKKSGAGRSLASMLRFGRSNTEDSSGIKFSVISSSDTVLRRPQSQELGLGLGLGLAQKESRMGWRHRRGFSMEYPGPLNRVASGPQSSKLAEEVKEGGKERDGAALRSRNLLKPPLALDRDSSLKGKRESLATRARRDRTSGARGEEGEIAPATPSRRNLTSPLSHRGKAPRAAGRVPERSQLVAAFLRDEWQPPPLGGSREEQAARFKKWPHILPYENPEVSNESTEDASTTTQVPTSEYSDLSDISTEPMMPRSNTMIRETYEVRGPSSTEGMSSLAEMPSRDSEDSAEGRNVSTQAFSGGSSDMSDLSSSGLVRPPKDAEFREPFPSTNGPTGGPGNNKGKSAEIREASDLSDTSTEVVNARVVVPSEGIPDLGAGKGKAMPRSPTPARGLLRASSSSSSDDRRPTPETRGPAVSDSSASPGMGGKPHAEPVARPDGGAAALPEDVAETLSRKATAAGPSDPSESDANKETGKSQPSEASQQVPLGSPRGFGLTLGTHFSVVVPVASAADRPHTPRKPQLPPINISSPPPSEVLEDLYPAGAWQDTDEPGVSDLWNRRSISSPRASVALSRRSPRPPSPSLHSSSLPAIDGGMDRKAGEAADEKGSGASGRERWGGSQEARARRMNDFQELVPRGMGGSQEFVPRPTAASPPPLPPKSPTSSQEFFARGMASGQEAGPRARGGSGELMPRRGGGSYEFVPNGLPNGKDAQEGRRLAAAHGRAKSPPASSGSQNDFHRTMSDLKVEKVVLPRTLSDRDMPPWDPVAPPTPTCVLNGPLESPVSLTSVLKKERSSPRLKGSRRVSFNQLVEVLEFDKGRHS